MIRNFDTVVNLYVKGSGTPVTLMSFGNTALSVPDNATFTVVAGAGGAKIGANRDQGAAYVFGSGAPLAAPVASPAALMAAAGALLAMGLRLLRRGREDSATQ